MTRDIRPTLRLLIACLVLVFISENAYAKACSGQYVQDFESGTGFAYDDNTNLVLNEGMELEIRCDYWDADSVWFYIGLRIEYTENVYSFDRKAKISIKYGIALERDKSDSLYDMRNNGKKATSISSAVALGCGCPMY